MRAETRKLWKQALYEREVAELLFTNEKFAAAHAQQTAEMALKAAYIVEKDQLYLRHSLDELAARLGAPVSVRRSAALLIPIYLASRYADAREDDAAPAEAITEKEAREALLAAEEVLAWCTKQMPSA